MKKIVVLMCVEEHVEEARELLKKQNVPAFTELPAKGYKNMEEDESENWFAAKHKLDYSHIFFSMCDEKLAEKLMEAIKTCSLSKQKNSVHAFKLDVEEFIG